MSLTPKSGKRTVSVQTLVYLDMESTSNPSKYDFIRSLLEKGDAMICLDSGRDGVSVPPEHKGKKELNLILSWNFPKPIEVEEDAVRATLSFGGRAFPCRVPMEAIWAVYDPQTGQGRVWMEDMPEAADAGLAPSGTKKAHLRVIK